MMGCQIERSKVQAEQQACARAGQSHYSKSTRGAFRIKTMENASKAEGLMNCCDVNFIHRLSHATMALPPDSRSYAWEYTPKDAVNHVKPVIDS